MENLDRRVRRTRKGLATALVELVNEKGYDAITIREITDRADIGYATFFRHYDSKDELMLGMFNQIMEDLKSQAVEADRGPIEGRGYVLFKHVDQNSGLYSGLLQSSEFSRRLRKAIGDEMLENFDRLSGSIAHPAFPLEVAANHCVSAVMGLMDWWLAKGKQIDIDRMAKIYERLIIEATWHVMDPDNPTQLPWDDEQD